MFLHVLVYLEQKELVRCCLQRQGSHITSGQPNGNRPSLQLYHHCIPVSCQAKTRGTNCSTKGLSRKHSHSHTAFPRPGKFQQQALFGALTFIKLYSKSLTSSYGPAAEWSLNIRNKAFKPASTDRHFYL